MKAIRVWKTCVTAATALMLSFSTAAYDVPEMRDAMRIVFSNMRILLELSADARNLKNPANLQAIQSATADLGEQASIIATYTARDEVGYLADSLDRYANWIRRSYSWGHFDDMRDQVQDTVDLCVACHTRLPSPGDSPLAKDFLKGHDMDSLSGMARARLQIATRRFDDALVTLEGVLSREPGAPDFFKTLDSYLVVALRVKGDSSRARRTLESLREHSDLDATRRGQLQEIVASLQRLESTPPAPGDLNAARTLVADAEARDATKGPTGLVDYVAASRLIYQFLDTGRGTVNDGAEAYYLLGLTRYRLDRKSWLPQTELFLEKAIRTAPGSLHSRRALTLLESSLRERFGKDGRPMPDDVVNYLRMLKELDGSDQ